MITDAWQDTRARAARLLGRGNPEEEARQEARLEHTHQELTGASEQDREDVLRRETAAWRARLEELLENEPEREADLHELMAFLVQQAPTAGVPQVNTWPSSQARQTVQGQGFQINHWYGSVGSGKTRTDTVLDTLVPPPTIMVGRDREIRELLEGCQAAQQGGRQSPLSAVHGMGGVGKTAVARTLAARLSGRFPDARLEVDLLGFTPGEQPRQAGEVLAELLSLVGFAAADVPAHTAGKSALWRAWLAGRRVLLVLDNVRDADQVLPLLPGSGGEHCLVLVLSRNRLDELDTAVRVGIDTLPVPDGVELLVRLAPRSAVERGDAQGLHELARLCGSLPLALRPVGALLAMLSPSDLVAAMRMATYPFQHLAEVDRAAAAAFSVSYEALSEGLQSMLRTCGWHPGPDFDAASIAALSDEPQPMTAVGLADLLRRNMLISLPQGRYAFHDVFAGYVRQRAAQTDTAATVTQARHRLYGHLCARIAATTDVLLTHQQAAENPDSTVLDIPTRAHTWLTAATDELNTAAHAALTEDWHQATELADKVAFWLYLDDRFDQSANLYTAMHATAQAARDRIGQAHALRGLGDVARMRDQYDQAADYFEQAIELHRTAGGPRGQAHALLGLGETAGIRDQYDRASAFFGQALQVFRGVGDRIGQAYALLGLGAVARMCDQYDHAAEYLGQAIQLYQAAGDRIGQAYVLRGQGTVARMRDQYEHAAEYLEQALRLHQAAGDRIGQAHALIGLGDVALLSDQYDKAADCFGQAFQLYQGAGDRRGQADALRGLGEVAGLRDRYDEAADCFGQALQLYHGAGDRRGQANTHLGLGSLAEAQGRRDAACRAYELAGELYAEIGLTFWVAHCTTARGHLDCSEPKPASGQNDRVAWLVPRSVDRARRWGSAAPMPPRAGALIRVKVCYLGSPFVR